jgi:hypothetical protein
VFGTPTVFILGAGASWHYGYPTGEELVKKIIEKAKYLARYFQHSLEVRNGHLPSFLRYDARVGAWEAALKDCNALTKGLEQVKPLVIDYYLGWNKHLQTLGRLLIAWVILECETTGFEPEENTDRGRTLLGSQSCPPFNNDWYRFIIHQLAINCRSSSDFLENNHVRFITFNYDVSLEIALYRGLRHIALFNDDDIKAFLGNKRILHIYGKVRSIPPVDQPELGLNDMDKYPMVSSEYSSNWKRVLDDLYDISSDILVIDPHDKTKNADVITAAIEAIDRSKLVYILGYGFDVNNSERLELAKSLCFYDNKNPKRVFFTNFQNRNRVNKRASNIFSRQIRFFSTDRSVETGGGFYYERSTRNVYDALEMDFEGVDDQLVK